MQFDFSDTRAQLGDHLRALRREAKLSQEDLADLTGLTANYIGMVERAERRITIEAAMSIAKALNAKLSDILRAVGE